MTLLGPSVTAAAVASAAASAAVAVLARGTFAPASTFWGDVVSRAPDGTGPRVALTFDDGPTPGSTEAVLDALAEAGVRAAFFVVGSNVERWPRILERIDREGHVVGNHTWEHSHYGVWRRDGYWRRELERTDDVIERVIGRRPALFRPPMGIKTWHVMRAARRAGQVVVTWNRRAFDGIDADPDSIVSRLAGPAGSGDLVLLHDGLEPHARRRDARATVATVRPLIAALRDKGLEPERLDALLGVRPYQDPAASAPQVPAATPVGR